MSAIAAPVLRPMRVPELLDATIRLYRRNFLLLIAIVAVIEVPLQIINGILSVPMTRAAEELNSFTTSSPPTYNPESPFPSGLGTYLAALGLQLVVSGTLGVIGGSLMAGALAWAISERHLDHPVSVRSAYRAVLSRWRSMIGSTLLVLLVQAALVALLLVPCIGQIAGIPAFLFTFVCLRFTPQAVMLEECRAGDALRRSWYLAKPHFWRVLGILALLWVFNFGLTTGPTYLVGFGSVAMSLSLTLQTVVGYAAAAILAVIYLPIQRSAETLVYYDLRVRQEGLDLEMEIEALSSAARTQAGGTPPFPAPEQLLPDVPPEPEAARPPQAMARRAYKPLLDSRDWRNLAILLGVGAGLLAVCCVAYFLLTAALSLIATPILRDAVEQIMTATPMP